MTVWVRVRSLGTGHHFDVALQNLDRLIARGAVEEIPGRRHTGRPKPPKPYRRLGLRAKQRRPAPVPADHKELR